MMVFTGLNIVLSLLLLYIFILDIRHRAVSWWMFPVTFLTQSGVSIYKIGWRTSFKMCFINLSVLSIVMLILYLYILIRNKRKSNATKMLIKQAIGLGDILFFVILAMTASMINFIFLFCYLLVFSLFIYIIVGTKKKTVPLAGLMALGYIPVVWLFFSCWVNPYIDILNF